MFGLESKIINEIKSITQKFPQNKFIVFGSRARGDYKYNSDIDIAVLGQCDDRQELNIRNEFDKMITYYSFDIVFYDNIIDQEVKNSIDREGVEI